MAIGATAPVWVRFAEPVLAAGSTPVNAPRHLLVVFLRGGNDPLQTVAPMGNAALLKLRPNVGLRDGDMSPMGNGYGVNNRLTSFVDFWRAGQLAVVQQVGTLTKDFSHSVATRKWESGNPEDRYNSGWLGRYLDATTGVGSVRAAAFGDSLPLSLMGDRANSLSLTSIERFAFNDVKVPDVDARRVALSRFASAPAPSGSMLEAIARGHQDLLAAHDPLSKIGNATINGRAPTLADNAAQLFAAGLGTEIGFISLAGFDTHSSERGRHASAITKLNDTIKNFFSTASKLGVRDQSVVLVVSEFGRRVYENKSGGTDHGEATSVFALGSPIAGGMYGPDLDLSQLNGGNLPTRIDLRGVYATVLDKWLRTNPAAILGATFPTIPFFR
ncbi:MAG: DUF1501 domain-containing protein [Actinobacteria bacterium]|nr:DUF1501 domain-containing protein [Actinomycetota bacterium]